MITDIERLLLAVSTRLEALGLAYAVGGSVASTRYGEPRGTNDLDLLLDLPGGKLGDLVRAIQGEWYVPEEAVRRAWRTCGSFNLIHEAWMDKVDFFLLSDDPLDRDTLARRVALRIGGPAGSDVWFSSAENIVLRKLERERRSGGVLTNQRRDVLGVLKGVGSALDLPYLRRQADLYRLRDILDSCLRDAGLEAGG